MRWLKPPLFCTRLGLAQSHTVTSQSRAMTSQLRTLYSGVLTLMLLLSPLQLCASDPQNTQDICKRDPPTTAASKTPGDNGFRIKIAGRPPPERYAPDHPYTVTINGTYPNQRLLGFMLVAVPFNAEDETTEMGTFQHMSSGLTKFADECSHVVTHTYRHPKAGVEVLWTAPKKGTGCVEFRATVIEYPDIWYKDDGALTKVFCEETGTLENNQSPEMMPDCCACGTAKYQMTFEGIWSRQTHPRDYPEHQRMLHWSNIVGASHSREYIIWQYGGHASRGVKEVCEFGYSRTLEQEMRRHSGDVRTVIKTPGIWWQDPDGLQQTRWARFSVDKRNHLLSMLTMLGPSPDWCVGVSALNLCLNNCSWAGDLNIDLFPWDAGTDDGLTYMSPNSKSDPQQKIHRITNTFPNNPVSPFYGKDEIPALASLKLRRIHPKPGTTLECTGNEEVEEGGIEFSETIGDGELSDMEMKKKLMLMKSGKCAVSDWLDWSECSVTCGIGKRMRKRMYLNPMADETMCGLPLIEAENCIGIENWCESPDQDCAVTQWSEWSPCSVSCGKGMQQRQRVYLNKEDMKTCQRETEQKEICVAAIMDCEKALSMKNFTAICALPMNIGPCRGNFQRWYYDTTMKKCLPFGYGGCRGNDNKFLTQGECMKSCHMVMQDIDVSAGDDASVTQPPDDQPKKGKHKPKPPKNPVSPEVVEPPEVTDAPDLPVEVVDCMITSWTKWSDCSATCGKAWKYKRRMVKRPAQGGGKKCPTKLEKRRRCKVPKCPTDCKMTAWGKWTPCAQTCGDDSIQERTRQILQEERRGGKKCGPRIERRYCNLPSCDEEFMHLDKDERMHRLFRQGQ